ncbi:glutamyl-tRNA reductase [Brachybacterium sp. EF45031]|uniref:glutamyl-tRNA reductase n=1 Tax=Brachybacterium sillae TaxID=2810536 RepID=UPI00217F202B|nr:glutamyl-tRNA reductase [Brachybacterium sillae]MCS6712094.1 glutamyl-tRNA reductase [Brachybacterium sillae]
MLVALRATHERLDLGVLDALTRNVDELDATIAAVEAERAGAEGTEPVLDGWVVVATCNRLEVYLDTRRFHDGIDVVVEAVHRTSGLDREMVPMCFETAVDAPVSQHLYEVTAGLRSIVLGEAEIAGQVRGAFDRAQSAGRTTSMLHDLFQVGFRHAKRVAREAPVGAAGRSGVSVALDRAETALAASGRSLVGARVLIIGTGAYARLGIAELHRRGAGMVQVFSGSGRADGFAERHDALAADDLQVAAQADLILAASGRGAVLRPQHLADRPVVVLDLALHSDLDPAVRELPQVRVIGLEDLAVGTDAVAAPALATAQSIIAEGVDAFGALRRARQVDPAVTALREAVEEALDAESSRLRQTLSDEAADEVERSVRRVMARVMHAPTARARELAHNGHADEYVRAFHTVFGVDLGSVHEENVSHEWMRLDRTVPPRLTEETRTPDPQETA